MPTPAAAIINGATTLTESFTATGVVWGYIGLFVAFVIGGLIVAPRLGRIVVGMFRR